MLGFLGILWQVVIVMSLIQLELLFVLLIQILLQLNVGNFSTYFFVISPRKFLFRDQLWLRLRISYCWGNTVTSRLFTHIVSIEKMRKDTRDRKDMKGTKYTYYNNCFLILLLYNRRLRTFTFKKICILYL